MFSSSVKPPVPEANHLPRTSAEVKKMWMCTSTPPHLFMEGQFCPFAFTKSSFEYAFLMKVTTSDDRGTVVAMAVTGKISSTFCKTARTNLSALFVTCIDIVVINKN
jgi:hypothetical protein